MGNPLLRAGGINGPGLRAAGPSVRRHLGGIQGEEDTKLVRCLWHVNDVGEIKTVGIRKLSSHSRESLDALKRENDRLRSIHYHGKPHVTEHLLGKI